MIFVRHGESEFNVIFSKTRQDPGIRDPRLTDRGHQQIDASAGYIAEIPGLALTQIVTSPYTRTLQSATILSEVLDLPIKIDPLVGEHAHFACDVGTPASQLKEVWGGIAFDALPEEWWPVQENEQDVDARAKRFRSKMAESANWETTLVVSHWGFIRGLTRLTVENATVVKVDPTHPHPTGGEVVWVPEV